ncbi:MAG: hypothetical protein AB1797_02645 [bacterium]
MKRNRIIIVFCTLFVIAFAGFAIVRWYHVKTYLQTQEKIIKNELNTVQIKHSRSNASDGVKRFLDTGKLIAVPSYFVQPSKMYEANMYYIRVFPRVTTHNEDGWVGRNKSGNWYVKIF